MSLGFSLGDLPVIFKFFKGALIICGDSVIIQLQDLIWEVQESEKILTQIHNLQCGPAQEAALSDLQRAAQRHKNHVDVITRKMERFKALRQDAETTRLKKLGARLKWGLTMMGEGSETRNDLRLYRSDLRTQQLIFLMNLQIGAPSLDTQHTWFQDPVTVEDALGDKWQVPSEHSWDVGVMKLNY